MSDYLFERFRLSSAPMRLFRDDKAVDLRAQALRLLLLLVERRGEVVSHADIRAAVWGERNVDSAKAIPLLIRNIRDALGESASAPQLIETVPREGYRFVGELRDPRKPLHLRLSAIAAAALFMIACGLWLQQDRSPGGADAADMHFKKGEYLRRAGGLQSDAKARDYFLAALEENPRHSEALASMAEMSVRRSEFDLAGEYANAAIAVDNSARGHLALAMIAAKKDWDWAGGAAHVEKALRRDPGLADAWITQAFLATIRGLSEDAVNASNRAYAIAPVDALVRIDHGWFHYYARDYESAYRLCNEAYALAPHSWPAAYCRLRSASSGEMQEAALEAAQDIYGMWTKGDDGTAVKTISSLGAFRRWHRNALQDSLSGGAPIWEAAAAAEMDMGREETAISLLETAAEKHSPNLPLTLRDPVFEPLVDDERFQSLLRVTGLAA